MKRAIARSRCEVDGKVYLPGDDMTVTDEQFAYLTQHNAVTEVKMQAVSRATLPSIADATIETVHGAYARKLKARMDKQGNGNKER